MGIQLSLYERKSLNPVPDLKRALAVAVKESGLSRADFVELLNNEIRMERLRTRGKDGLVTEDMLNKWLAREDMDSAPPTKLLKIIGTVAKSAALAQALLPEGCRAIGPDEVFKLEWAEAMLAGRKAQRKARRLAEQIEDLKK
jgi:hypothetical protein